MKKLTGILMAVCLASSLIAGCGQKAGGQNTQTTNGQSAAQTESQTTGNPSETGNGNGEEKSAAQHCILLAVKNGTWLLADRDNGAVFTAEIPSDLTDESGKKISSEILKAADYVDVYGDGIMLQSYPGQYPGVSKMVVTGEGSEDELKQYQNTFIFFSKVRRSVKIRYCDAIDNREYEPLMQNLLDTHLSVAGLKQITSPIDILNKDDFERELEELGSLRAKADAITSKLTRSISEKYQENPAYYDSFSKRIKDALEQYKEKVISEAEYLAKMRTIMEDYHTGKSTVTYPESIKNNVHAQAFYGVLSAVFDEAKEAEISPDFAAEIAEEITKIVANHSQVDWTNNKTIHDRISQDIDDLFYDYEKERGLKLSFDTIDKIIENVKTVALRRF